MNSKITTEFILNEFPTLPPYTLEYWIKCKKIKVIKYGKGLERTYPPNILDEIKSILKARNES